MMTGGLPSDVATTIDGVLEPGEDVLGAVTTLAGTLVLTDRRVVILREGRTFRPATGIRSWGLTPANEMTFGPPRGGVGRLIVGRGNRATSFFVRQRDWHDALDIVTMARRITYLATVKSW
jgi:hypothetical protein